jgi:hypothetical protein
MCLSGDAPGLEERAVTPGRARSKLRADMERVSMNSRRVLTALALAAVLAAVAPTVLAQVCPAHATGVTAGEGKQPENRPPRQRCKHSGNSRGNNSKTCPDGGERAPQDKRSPLDEAPPLSPLVA